MNLDMFCVEARFDSFSGKWPIKTGKCVPKKLAETGFYYTGNKESPDATRCFMCGKDLDGWDRNDDPAMEHQKHSPQCPLLNFEIESNRLLSFAAWPYKTTHASPEAFARAGFFLFPSKETLDQVKCFSCKKVLGGWEEQDDPMKEHMSHSTKCSFIMSLNVEAETESQVIEVEVPTTSARPAPKQKIAQTARPLAAIIPDILAEPPATIKRSPFKTVNAEVPDTVAKPKRKVDHFEVNEEIESMTVEQYLRAFCESQVHQFRRTVEQRVKDFQDKAAEAREKLAALQ